MISAKPFVKWAGGKRWLAPLIANLVEPRLGRRYFEPFLGGGAVFFQLQPSKAVLSDFNAELVRTFVQVRDNPQGVIEELSTYKNSRTHHNIVRQTIPEEDVKAAARLIYLTFTSWGGLYRVNRRGTFNVPFANSGRAFCSSKDIAIASMLLKKARIKACDFAKQIDQAQKGDVVYADPPYTTKGENNGFVRYNESLFSWNDQQRLAESCKAASERGGVVLVSGLFHEDILKLYKGWHVLRLERSSTVARKAISRGLIHEALILNFRPSAFEIKCASDLIAAATRVQRCLR